MILHSYQVEIYLYPGCVRAKISHLPFLFWSRFSQNIHQFIEKKKKRKTNMQTGDTKQEQQQLELNCR